MNLIDENYDGKRGKKKIYLALGSGIIVLIVIIIALLAYLASIKGKEIVLNVDQNSKLSTGTYMYKDENGDFYIWIEGLTNVTKNNGYKFKTGSPNSEDDNKCYITNEHESTFFEVGSDTIYKTMENTDDIEFYTLSRPIIKVNTNNVDRIYIPIEDVDVAMNTIYSRNGNTFTLNSIGYMESIYTEANNPDTSIVWETSYSNKKLLKQHMVIVQDDLGRLGLAAVTYNTQQDKKNKKKSVSTVSTTHVITPKYNGIEYVEKYNQLIVEDEDGKKGIIQLFDNGEKETVVTPRYDEIKPINDKLFLVSNNTGSSSSDSSKDNKDNVRYGIIGKKDKEILPMEYNEIGMDISKYSNNGLTSQYIIYKKLIPVRKDKLWGLVNTDGDIVIKIEYDGLGCDVSNNDNNVIIVPKLDAIVVKKDGKYGIVNDKNLVLVKNTLTKVYKEEDKEDVYYVVINDKKEEVTKYINSLEDNSNNNDNNNNNNDNNNNDDNNNDNNDNNNNDDNNNDNNDNNNNDDNNNDNNDNNNNDNNDNNYDNNNDNNDNNNDNNDNNN